MITFSKLGVNGSIGNQMFQYATLLSVALKNKYKYTIPEVDDYYNHDYERQEIYFKKGFKNISAERLSPTNLLKISNKFNQCHGEVFKFSPQVLNVPDNCDIFGYFQSYKYFIDFKDKIIDEFTFNDWLFDNINIDLINIANKCSSIHIRAGDYKRKQNVHRLLDLSYYAEAIRLCKTDKFLVFSDDDNYAEKILQEIVAKVDFIFIKNNNPFLDLLLMSLCKNNIIANSTFSWWAAFLNKHEDKIVVAPKIWFGPDLSGQNIWVKDLIPDKWTTI